MKRFQNKASESRISMPVAAAYGLGVWLVAGLVLHHWWIQFVCFVVSTFIMVELNNSNALIRIYSRMVSAAFIFLSCTACFLFSSLPGSIFQLCMIASLYTLFRCYQDKTATGWTFYTFLLLGLASLAEAHAFYFVPVYWVIMFLTIYSLSWRNFSASILGLLLPYGVYVTGILFSNDGDFTPLIDHLEPLICYILPYDYTSLPLSMILTYVLLIAVTITGIVHYMRTSFRDNIRIRQLFYTLMVLNVFSAVLVAFQPQHAQVMLRTMIITVSPLIGHFISLTSTRITNIAFFVIIAITVLITGFNLWML
jgi:hypothetical protein